MTKAHKCDGCRYKGEHQEMMFRPMGICNRGVNLVEAVQNYEAEKCPYKKTNSDRIRAMSDEELGKFLCSLSECFNGRCPGSDICCPGKNGCCEWLKQPAGKEV